MVLIFWFINTNKHDLNQPLSRAQRRRPIAGHCCIRVVAVCFGEGVVFVKSHTCPVRVIDSTAAFSSVDFALWKPHHDSYIQHRLLWSDGRLRCFRRWSRVGGRQRRAVYSKRVNLMKTLTICWAFMFALRREPFQVIILLQYNNITNAKRSGWFMRRRCDACRISVVVTQASRAIRIIILLGAMYALDHHVHARSKAEQNGWMVGRYAAWKAVKSNFISFGSDLHELFRCDSYAADLLTLIGLGWELVCLQNNRRHSTFGLLLRNWPDYVVLRSRTSRIAALISRPFTQHPRQQECWIIPIFKTDDTRRISHTEHWCADNTSATIASKNSLTSNRQKQRSKSHIKCTSAVTSPVRPTHFARICVSCLQWSRFSRLCLW